jgi:hypothetical protein
MPTFARNRGANAARRAPGDVRDAIEATMDVAAIFDRPSKVFTILREPVDRVISNFFFNRTATDLPLLPIHQGSDA